MKQRIYVQFIFSLLVITGICGQNTCLSGVHFIQNQNDVDAIILNYPNCEIIEGDIFIWGDESGENITNLDGFLNIKEIRGFLQLRSNPEINDLYGLSNIENIGGRLYIQGNDQLTNLEGLNNVKNIGSIVFIGQNDVLETLAGLDAVESINGRLIIRNNDLLTDISSLKNIDPNSIQSEVANDDDLTIINNMSLSECSVENLCAFFGIQGRTNKINNNNLGCLNEEEIKNGCLSSSEYLNVGKVSIFPNPSYTHLMVSADNQFDHVSILNTYGMTVKEVINTNQDQQLNIDVSDLNSGIYFVLVSSGNSKIWKKMVKK